MDDIMTISSLKNKLESASPDVLRKALEILFAPHQSPVFGAAKTVEHEVAALNALKLLDCLSTDADEFDLVDTLRVTRSKARALLYQAALRTVKSNEENTESLRRILSSRSVTVDGKYFAIEVSDPLLLEDLRRRIRRAGYVSDGTFSNSIARLPEAALSALIIDIIPKDERKEVENQLTKLGYEPKTFQAVVGRLLKSAASKALGDAGAQAVGVIGDEVGGLFKQGISALTPYVKP